MDNFNCKDFVKRVDKLLEQHNLKRNKLLKMCKINSGFLNNLESKGTVPSIDKIISIANYLNVSLEYLVFGKDNTNSNSINTGEDIKTNNPDEQDEQELLEIYRCLDRKRKIRVNSFIYDEIEDMERSGERDIS